MRSLSHKLKAIFISLIFINLPACSLENNPISIFGNSSKNLEVITLKKLDINQKDNKQILIAEVTKNEGASIYVNLVEPKPGFNVKDSVLPKELSDIDYFLIYLIKNSNTTSYPLDGDPMGSDLVSGPFTISYDGTGNKLLKFTGINDSNGAAYYIAVRAKDSSDNNIIKDNNGSATAWTGITASSPGVAVSTGNGIRVNSSLEVSSNIPVTVDLNLLDGS